MGWPTCKNAIGSQDFLEIDIWSLMESEKDMNAGEGLVNLMPTEKLVVVGSLPIGMPLYGSDADNFVHHNTTSFGIRGAFVIFFSYFVEQSFAIRGLSKAQMASHLKAKFGGMPTVSQSRIPTGPGLR